MAGGDDAELRLGHRSRPSLRGMNSGTSSSTAGSRALAVALAVADAAHPRLAARLERRGPVAAVRDGLERTAGGASLPSP